MGNRRLTTQTKQNFVHQWVSFGKKNIGPLVTQFALLSFVQPDLAKFSLLDISLVKVSLHAEGGPRTYYSESIQMEKDKTKQFRLLQTLFGHHVVSFSHPCVFVLAWETKIVFQIWCVLFLSSLRFV